MNCSCGHLTALQQAALAFSGHEFSNARCGVGPDSATRTKASDNLRIPGSALPEIGRPHSSFREEGIDFVEKLVCVGHGANHKSAIADSQRSSMAFVQSNDEADKIEGMKNLSTVDDGWRQRLKAVIEQSGRSQGDIAVSCGLSRGYFTNILRDGKEPTIGNLIAISQELGISLSKILYGYEVSPETEEILQIIENNPDLRDGILKILKTQAKL